MAKIHGHVQINIENCKGCELCVNECPQGSLQMSKNINKKGYHYAVLVADNCTGCTNCALVCPEAIITVYRESKVKKSTSTTQNISLATN
jgi:2-oxoglutarate ferredoxin oxidoreductase subunit delta